MMMTRRIVVVHHLAGHLVGEGKNENRGVVFRIVETKKKKTSKTDRMTFVGRVLFIKSDTAG